MEKEPFDLHQEVKKLLIANKKEWKRIQWQADVSDAWIQLVVNDKIPNPGYATLKKVYKSLIGEIS